MQKNGKKIAVMGLLAVIAVGSYFVSGTYAKYTRALKGSDTATVAKFSVSAGDLTEGTAEISLFNTTKEADGTSTEDHVLQGKIAPGTGGQFPITLTNNSEVDVKAEIKIAETGNDSGIPIEYSTDGTTWKKAAEFTKTVDRIAYKPEGGTAKTADINVYWRWVYETDPLTDDADTGFGSAATAPTVTVTVTATFTQID